MKTETKHHLLQRAVDGTLSDHEKPEWQALLQRDPELLKEFELQKEIVAALEGLPTVEAPAHLGDSILRAVKRQKAGRTIKRSFWSRRPVLDIKYIYSFSAGLALGLLLLLLVHSGLFTETSLQTSQLSGTLRTMDSGWQSKTISGAKIHGKISWKYQDAAMDVQLILKPQESADIVFDYARNHLQLRGIRNDAGAPLQGLHMDEGRLTLPVNSLCKLQLSFDRQSSDAAPVQLLIKKNNELFFTYQLD